MPKEPTPDHLPGAHARRIVAQEPASSIRANNNCHAKVARIEDSGSTQQKDDESNDENGSEYAAADVHVNLRLYFEADSQP